MGADDDVFLSIAESQADAAYEAYMERLMVDEVGADPAATEWHRRSEFLSGLGMLAVWAKGDEQPLLVHVPVGVEAAIEQRVHAQYRPVVEKADAMSDAIWEELPSADDADGNLPRITGAIVGAMDRYNLARAALASLKEATDG